MVATPEALFVVDDTDEIFATADVDGSGVIELDFGPPIQGEAWLLDSIVIVTNAAAGLSCLIYSGGRVGDTSLSNVRDGALTGASGVMRGEYPRGLYIAPGRRLRVRITGAAAATRAEASAQIESRRKTR